MLNDKQIKEALEAEAAEAAVPADLIRDRVKQSGGRLIHKPGLWHKLQIGRRLVVILIFLVLLGFIFAATIGRGGPETIFLGAFGRTLF